MTMLKALLFDLDGVLYVGDEAVAGAAETLGWVRDRAIPHLFVTNTTSRPRSAIVDKLAGMGVRVDQDELLTPPVAAATWLREHNTGPVALFVPGASQKDFAGLEILDDGAESGAGAVVVGDLGDGWSFARLNRAFRLLMAGETRLIALGMTRYWQAPDGLRLDAGAMVSALSYASGIEPLVLGKPAVAFFQAAVSRLGVMPGEVLMVGDDLVSDCQGAQRAGLQAALVRTGKFRPSDLEKTPGPELVLDSIADLPEAWRGVAGD